MSDATIAVTGATGEVGRRVAERLARAGARMRLVVRDREHASLLPDVQVRPASGYGAGDEMRAALEGAETVFLIPAAEAPDRAEQHATAVDAALAAGVDRLVYLSFVGAAEDSTFTFGRDHWATEQHIRATGLPFTFLRMNLYMDFMPPMVGADGVIRGPAGDGRIAAVLRDDLADAAAAVLTGGDHEGRTYDLTGRESFSLGEAAELMSRTSGKDIRFVDESVEEAYESRSTYGAPDWEVAGWVSSYLAAAAGELDAVSSDVARLAGHEPLMLAEYLEDHPESLGHVGE